MMGVNMCTIHSCTCTYIYRYIIAIYPTSEEVESKLGGFAGDHAREGWAFLHSKAGLENASFMVHPCWDLDTLGCFIHGVSRHFLIKIQWNRRD